MTFDYLPRVNVLGTMIAAIDLETAVDQISQWISQEHTGRYVCVTGVHGVMESLHDDGVRRAHASASACVPDGMPLTWVGRWSGYKAMDRVYGPDLMLRLLSLSAQRGFSNYFYGGVEGVAGELETRMVSRFHGLRVVGTNCPPFRPLDAEEEAVLISDVNAKRPDLFWVGLSTPKQELFMERYHSLLLSKVMIGVGAAFDFHTGRVRQAPRWMMRSGLEWFFRLCTEPRRLAPRYLKNNPAFMLHVFLQLTGFRSYPSI